MSFDAHANFAYGSVLTAPSPPTSGTTLVLNAGEGALMPAVPFNLVVWQTSVIPLATNAEIVRVTARATDTLTIVRAQEGSSARAIVAGDQVMAGITKKTLTDIETAIPSTAGLLSAVNISAGTTSQNLSALTFSNGSGVSFGLNGSVLTATVATNYLTTARASNDAIGLNTAQTNVTWTVNSSGISLNAGGYAGTGFTGAGANITFSGTHNTAGLSLSASVAAAAGSLNVSAGTTSNNLTAITFSNLNGVSFGLNASTLTASIATSLTNINVSAGTTSNNLSALTFSNANGVSFGLNGSVLTGSVTPAGGAQTGISGIIASDATYTSGTVSFSAQANITIGSSTNGASQYVRLSVAPVTNSSWTLSDAATSVTISRMAFTNSNGLTLSLSTGAGAATVIGSYTVPTVTNSSWTVSDNATSGSVARLAFTNLNGVTLSLSTGAGGSHTIVGSHNALTSQSNQAFSAGGGSSAFQTLSFGNSFGVSFSNSNGSVVGSIATTYAGTGFTSAGANISLSGTLNTAGLSLSASVAAQSNQSAIKGLGASNTGNTAGNTGLSTGIDWVIAGTNNVTVSQSTTAGGPNTLWLSGATVAGQPVNFSAGTTSNNLGSVVFSNSGGISFGLNGSTITASASTVGTATTVFDVASAASVGTVTRWAAEDHRHAGIGSIGISTQGNTAGATGFGQGAYWFAADNGITVSQRTTSPSSAYTLSFYGPPHLSYFVFPDNWNGMVTGGSAITQTSGSSIYVQPFVLPWNLSASYIRFLASYNDSAVGTAGTTSANTTFSVARYTTFGVMLFSQGIGGVNSRAIQTLYNTTAGMTGVTIYSAGAQGSQYTITVQKTYPDRGFTTNSYTTSYAVSSGSIVISSNSNTLFTGPRWLDIPFASSLGPGNYWIGLGASTSSASNSSNISFAGTAGLAMSIAGVSQSNVSVGVLGAATSASDQGLQVAQGLWTTNASIFTTDKISMANVSQVVSNPALAFQFIRQV